eukprot:4491373-Pyramimonas_sp.AAC.1
MATLAEAIDALPTPLAAARAVLVGDHFAGLPAVAHEALAPRPRGLSVGAPAVQGALFGAIGEGDHGDALGRVVLPLLDAACDADQELLRKLVGANGCRVCALRSTARV